MKKLIFFITLILVTGCQQAKKEATVMSENNYPKMNLKHIHTEAKDVQTKLLLKAEEGKVMSLQIAKGKQLKEHVSEVPAILICISGNAIYRDLSGEVDMLNGDYLFITAGAKHEVQAITDSNFILVK